MRFSPGWPSKTTPNMSKHSRSSQSAVPQTDVTEGQGPSTGTFSRRRSLREKEERFRMTWKRGLRVSQSTAVRSVRKSNFSSSFRYRQTSSNRSRPMTTMACLRSSVASPPAAPKRPRGRRTSSLSSGGGAGPAGLAGGLGAAAAGAGVSAGLGSSFFCSSITGRRRLIQARRAPSHPIKRALLVEPEIADEQDAEKDQHLHQAEQTQLVVLHRPGKEEDCLHVEDDEQDGDDVKAHPEAAPGVALRRNPALIGLQPVANVPHRRPHQLGDPQGDHGNQERQDGKQQDGNVVFRHRLRSSST